MDSTYHYLGKEFKSCATCKDQGVANYMQPVVGRMGDGRYILACGHVNALIKQKGEQTS